MILDAYDTHHDEEDDDDDDDDDDHYHYNNHHHHYTGVASCSPNTMVGDLWTCLRVPCI